jgi:hypothetical protein
MSATGQYQAIIEQTSPYNAIYVSINYGVSWTVTFGNMTSGSFYSVAMSASGQYINIGSQPNVLQSSNYGSSFVVVQSSPINWYSIAVSSSGQYITVAGSSSYWLLTSSNYGSNNQWNSPTAGPTSTIQSIAMSASGQYQTALGNPGFIWQSTNYGVTFTQLPYSETWYSIAMTASGQYQTAITTSGVIWKSTNYGNTWTPTFTISNMTYVAISSSGQYQTAVQKGPGYIWYSTIPIISLNAGAYYLNGVPKTFVIDHPTKNDKYLVHACLEGPEAGVYYRGEAKITNNISTIVILPDYLETLATNYTTHLTPIYDDNDDEQINLKCSRVKNNKFTVYGKNCSFYWLVYGERFKIDTEPLKINTSVKGEGPYKWINIS